MLYTYSFSNRKRDLSDILSTVIKDEPRFISNFRTVEPAAAQKHEWFEDQLTGRAVTAGAVAAGTVTASAADVAKLKVGTLLVLANDSALFRVDAIPGFTSFTASLVAANGSGVSTIASGAVLNIVSSPMAEGQTPATARRVTTSPGPSGTPLRFFVRTLFLPAPPSRSTYMAESTIRSTARPPSHWANLPATSIAWRGSAAGSKLRPPLAARLADSTASAPSPAHSRSTPPVRVSTR